MATNPDLAWALADLQSERIELYKRYNDYYEGDQPLAFATKKFRTQFWRIFSGFADNLCQAVVDVQSERLEVVGFTSDKATTEEVPIRKTPEGEPDEEGPTVRVVSDEPGDEAFDLWENNGMDLAADAVHRDALLFGDGFLILKPDDTTLWPQAPVMMAVRYSQDDTGVIEVAAKAQTLADERVRVTLYYPDRLERWETDAKPGRKGTKLKVDMFGDRPVETQNTPAMLVFHFPNRNYGGYGYSELKNVIPLQDALNKTDIDQLVAMEYQAFRQRYVTGVDVELDETGSPKNVVADHGPGHFLAFPDPDSKVGEFDATDISPYDRASNQLAAKIARVSGIPMHYLFIESTGSASGEALKAGELRFQRKGRRQRRCFGKVWELVMAAATDNDGVDLNVVWSQDSPRSESEEMDVLIKKSSIGVPNSQLQREAGYDPDQIAQFAMEKPVHPSSTVPTEDGGDTPGEAPSSTAGGALEGVEPPPAPPKQ